MKKQVMSGNFFSTREQLFDAQKTFADKWIFLISSLKKFI